MITDATTLNNSGDNICVGDGDRFQRHLAIVNQNGIARRHVARQAKVSCRDRVCVAGDISGCDGEFGALLQQCRPLCKGAQSNLGSLQIDEDPNTATCGISCSPNVLVDHLVIGV